MKRLSFLFILFYFIITSACQERKSYNDFARYVNPIVAAGQYSHTFPGPILPNGMIQPSPNTYINSKSGFIGYYYKDSIINGFTHTHLHGTECANFGDILVMPMIEMQKHSSCLQKEMQYSYASKFSHDNEVATPGYYSVFLDRYKIKVELSCTARSAIHRYTYPQSKDAGIILDLDYSNKDYGNSDLQINIISNTEISGYKITNSCPSRQKIHFYAKFSKPFTHTIIKDTIIDSLNRTIPICKALLQFSTVAKEQVMMKIGFSYVDSFGAQHNVETEIPDWDFESVSKNAYKIWKDCLSKIEINSADQYEVSAFYTALYHAYASPNLHIDIDGRYLGIDNKILQGKTEYPIYTNYSTPKSFRSLHPLLSMTNPELNNKMLQSLLQRYHELGKLPQDEINGIPSLGSSYHSVSLFADAYIKNNFTFDLKEVYEACLKTAEYNTLKEHIVINSEPSDIKNTINRTISSSFMENAYNAWCLSILSNACNDFQNRDKYYNISKSYKKYIGLNPDKSEQKFSENNTSVKSIKDIINNSRYIIINRNKWFAPHDIEGLIQQLGGKNEFIKYLDDFFNTKNISLKNNSRRYLSRFIGLYDHQSPICHHIPHLYNYVGQPWKTQELLDSIVKSNYKFSPEKYTGNDDNGQMSGWYILNSIGIYQICPGRPLYSIGRPLFDSTVIHLANAKTLTIKTVNNSPKNKYIQSASFNGNELEIPFLEYEDLVEGGSLVFIMSDKPSKWGTTQL